MEAPVTRVYSSHKFVPDALHPLECSRCGRRESAHAINEAVQAITHSK